MTQRPLVVAHRAGNDPTELRAAEALGVDIVEADLHLFRRSVEVRHEKTIGPLPILWERWRIIRPTGPRRRFTDLLAEASSTTHLMLDLKGPFPRLSRAVRAEFDRSRGGDDYTVCARNWLLLRAFWGVPGVRTVRSIGGPFALSVLLWGRHRQLEGVSVNQLLLDERRVIALRRRSDFLLAWGVTTVDRVQELSAYGVTGFIVDDVNLMGAILASGRFGTVRTANPIGTSESLRVRDDG